MIMLRIAVEEAQKLCLGFSIHATSFFKNIQCVD